MPITGTQRSGGISDLGRTVGGLFGLFYWFWFKIPANTGQKLEYMKQKGPGCQTTWPNQKLGCCPGTIRKPEEQFLRFDHAGTGFDLRSVLAATSEAFLATRKVPWPGPQQSNACGNR